MAETPTIEQVDTIAQHPGDATAPFSAPAGRPTHQRRPLTLFTVPGWFVVAGMLLVGLTFNGAMRNDTWSVAGALWVTAMVIVVAARPAGGRSRWVAVSALAFVPWFAVRASGWLLVPDLVVALGLVVWAASGPARAGRGVTRRIEGLAGRFATSHLATWNSSRNGVRRLFGTRRSAGAAVRGAAIALPVVLVLGSLLAAGDAFFANWLTPDVSFGAFAGHAALVVLGAWFAAFLLAPDPPTVLPVQTPRLRLGDLEIVIVLAAVTVLFGVWAIAQAVAATGGRERVLTTAGLTYAEWARSGFFQLVWVAVLTAALLVSLALMARNERFRRVRVVLSLVVAALTLVMMVVSLVKLDLYADQFGLTMLRLYVTVFAGWLGALFVVIGAALVSQRVRRVAVGIVVGSALVGVFAMNVVNPEAAVVRTNVDRAERGERFDATYIDRLGADGLVALADAVQDGSPVAGLGATEALCADRSAPDLFESRYATWVPDRRGGDGLLGWNRASRRLVEWRAALC